MLQVIKYLPICIVLVSSGSIEASKSHEDCDYGDCGQTGYFASGSAYSSQVLLPDGSVVTNSKGSSISSDGIQRSFHELKQEADKYVSNSEPKTTYITRNEYADREPILRVQPSFQSSYQNNLPQESENARSPSNVISVPNSNQPPLVYYRPVPEVPQDLLDTNVETDNKLGSPADASESASMFQKKIRSYWRRMEDANANIPFYLLSPKANTFAINGINLAYKNEEVNGFIPDLIPPANIKETHYTKDISIREQSEPNVQYTPPAPPKIPYHVKITDDEAKKLKLEQTFPHPGMQDRSTRGGGALGNDGRRTKLVIKAKSSSEPIASSQPFRRETNSQQIKSNAQPLPADMNSGAPVQGVMVPAMPDIPQNDAVAPEPDNYMYVPLPSSVQMASPNDESKNGQVPQRPMFHLNFPILLRGVPQNIRIAYPNSDSKSSINQIYESATGSSLPDGVSTDSSSNNLVPDVAPQNIDHSSSSTNLHYFITNGYVGEQLVPNSDIYVPSDAVLQHNQQMVNNANLNLGVPTSPDMPQKSSYIFSTSFSQDVGKKMENPAASVTVNENDKMASYVRA